jgi:RHS repeat-associated protein
LLKTIKWEGAQIEDRSYNDNGLLTGVTRAFVNETRTYNAGSQLTQINNTNVGSQTYTYDQNGNVTSETLSGNMANYSFSTIHAGGPFADGYDAEDRFMRFKRSGVTEDILLTRSNIGNISNVNRNGTNTARGYNTAHGLTTVSGGTTQTYDTDGNTTNLHTNVTAVWDDAGRMKHTDVPAGATAGIVGLNENGYVGGTRVWKKITRSGSVVEHRVHIHAGPNLIAEYNAGVVASTPVQEYVYAGEIDSLVMIRRSDATKYGVTRNRQWSITALHDLANGNIVERYAYEMTGKRTIYAANGTTVRTTSSYGNNFGYTSRWHDAESGLMYFRARYYNPLTGEFLSRDPMEFVDGMSLYRGYFGLGAIDPHGSYCIQISTGGEKGGHRNKPKERKKEDGVTQGTAKGRALGWWVDAGTGYELERCNYCCPDGEMGYAYSGSISVGVSLGISGASYGFSADITARNGNWYFTAGVNAWLGLRLYGTVYGEASFGVSLNTCDLANVKLRTLKLDFAKLKLSLEKRGNLSKIVLLGAGAGTPAKFHGRTRRSVPCQQSWNSRKSFGKLWTNLVTYFTATRSGAILAST